jgi:hypothetical protein
MGKRIDRNIENEICKRYMDGESSVQLGKYYNITPSTILKSVRRNNAEVRPFCTVPESIQLEICGVYLSGMNSSDIIVEYNNYVKNRTSVCSILERHNVKRRNSGESQRYYVDDNFFSNINSEITGYWLGFIFADGCVSDRNTLAITTQRRDRHHLERFTNDLKYEGNICDYNVRQYECSSIQIASKQICEDLIKLGCTPRKSLTLEFPDINDDVLRFFILGVLDGDGYIAPNGRNVQIVTTKMFAEKLKEIVKEKLGVEAKIKDIHNPNGITRVFALYGKNCRKFLDWLYKDATIFLQRKYEKYLNGA